jgi:hypothetical protein
LITLIGAARKYAFCVGLGVLVGNGWVEDAAELGDEGKGAGRVPPAPLLSLNFRLFVLAIHFTKNRTCRAAGKFGTCVVFSCCVREPNKTNLRALTRKANHVLRAYRKKAVAQALFFPRRTRMISQVPGSTALHTVPKNGM